MRTVMSDTFAFRSLPVPLRSRVNVRAVKTVVALCLVVAAVGSFSRWIIRSERASFVAAAEHTALDRQPASRTPDLSLPASGVVAIPATDVQVQAVASATVGRALKLLRSGGSPADAGPARLAEGSHGVIYTDGASIGPRIVSVATTHTAWGAAVMSESGRCFAVRFDVHGLTAYGTLSSGCTGLNALRVAGASW
jgi:hypothetical protein